jgi:hypothetical protein
MSKSTKQTRYAVVARSTGKTLKNAATRESAREWKRDSGKSGLGIFDRQRGEMIS